MATLNQLQVTGGKVQLKARPRLPFKFTPSPAKSNLHFDVSLARCAPTFRSPKKQPFVQATPLKPNSGGVCRAQIRAKKPPANRSFSRHPSSPVSQPQRPRRQVWPLHIVSFPSHSKVMMDFEPRTPHQLIVNGVDDSHSIKSCSLYSKTSYLDTKDRIPDPMDTDSSSRNQSSDSEVDAATADYLRNAYAQLHETRYRKMNRLLSSIDDQQSDDDCDIAVLANNVANFGLKGNAKKTKPIITFTPVHSVEEQLSTDFQSPPGTSPLPSPVSESRGSSGSSSPLLEVPTSDFHNVALEMMRPPLN